MITLKFSTASAAFDEPSEEIARILRHLAKQIEDRGLAADHETLEVVDLNGNVVGRLNWENE